MPRFSVIELQNTDIILKAGRKEISYKGITITVSRLLPNIHHTYYMPTLSQVPRTQDE